MSNSDVKFNPGLRPFQYHIIVNPDSAERKTAGGVIMPDSNLDYQQVRQNNGTLVAVGDVAFVHPDRKDMSDCPKPGDRIVYQRHAGGSSKFTGRDGKDYILIKDDDVLGIGTVEFKEDE